MFLHLKINHKLLAKCLRKKGDKAIHHTYFQIVESVNNIIEDSTHFNYGLTKILSTLFKII
jgi:hypothetical protein